MKTSSFLFLVMALSLSACQPSAPLPPPKPTAAEALEQWQQDFAQHSDGSLSSTFFWENSRRLAEDYGVAIIPAILDRSEKWEEMEGLIFVAIILSLPPEQALAVLQPEMKSTNPQRALWAQEFVIEMEMYFVEMRNQVSKILEETKKP